MEVGILTGLIALASEISIRHVLVLNLIGWMLKCFLTHLGYDNWTDVIPVILALCGVLLVHIDQLTYDSNFIIYGLSNAGMAWLLHQLVKETKRSIRKITGDERPRDN